VAIENIGLSEEREKARLFEEREKAWKTISARAAHKIGNQNFAIKGFLPDLRKERLGLKAQKLVEDISECVRTIDGVIDEFKSLSKPIKLNKKMVSLKDEIAKVIQRYPFREGIEINLVCEEDFISADVDMVHLRLALIELLDNASKFIHGKGNLYIRLRKPNENEKKKLPISDIVAIEIEDNGLGIPPELKEKIFEPFFAGQESKGSGLGLTIVKQTVEAHKGIIFEQGEKDQGARFVILIPKGGG